MTEHVPDFDTLVDGDDLDPAARARLRAMHDLLVTAGPPPEVSPTLRSVAVMDPTVRTFPRRHRRTLLLAAAVAAIALFGGGYLVGHASGTDSAFTVPMRGDHGERAELVVFDKDAAGNWPMRLRLSAVTLDEGAVYELWLTRAGKLAEQCGAFLALPGRTSVPLNAPYRLKDFDGWVVVPKGSQKAILWTPANEA